MRPTTANLDLPRSDRARGSALIGAPVAVSAPTALALHVLAGASATLISIAGSDEF